jgi:hypothetical protein
MGADIRERLGFKTLFWSNIMMLKHVYIETWGPEKLRQSFIGCFLEELEKGKITTRRPPFYPSEGQSCK